ncbi:MAG: hypothetical protein HY039_07350 [Nitrospirae bacterium]|nr:hypothetical protein [Nitrospirota bacterium]
MNCKDAVERLMDLGPRSELRTPNSELRTQDPLLAAHIEACPACAKETEELARLFSVLRRAEGPTDAEAAVLARRVVTRLGEKKERRSPWALRPAWGIAAAAAAVVLIIVWTAIPGGKPGPATQVSFQPASSDRPAGGPPRQPVENEGAETGGVLLAFSDEPPDRNEWSDEEIREARVTLAAADADLLARDMVDPADVYRVFALMSEEDRAGLLSALSERKSSLGSPDRAVMSS